MQRTQNSDYVNDATNASTRWVKSHIGFVVEEAERREMTVYDFMHLLLDYAIDHFSSQDDKEVAEQIKALEEDKDLGHPLMPAAAIKSHRAS